MQEFELRMYDPRIGRWISADPYNQYHSPYVGIGNNPLTLIDPNGGVAGPGGGGLFWKWVANPTTLDNLAGQYTRTVFGEILNVGGSILHASRGFSSLILTPGTVMDVYAPNNNISPVGYYVNAKIRLEETYNVRYSRKELNGQETRITTWDETFYIHDRPFVGDNVITSNGQTIYHKNKALRKGKAVPHQAIITLSPGKEAVLQTIQVNGLGTSSHTQPALSPRVNVSNTQLDVLIDHAIKVHGQLANKRYRRITEEITKDVAKELSNDGGLLKEILRKR